MGSVRFYFFVDWICFHPEAAENLYLIFITNKDIAKKVSSFSFFFLLSDMLRNDLPDILTETFSPVSD